MQGEEYDVELAKLPTNLYDDDDDDEGTDTSFGEPSRPTSAPPMLDNLFSFPVNGFAPATTVEDTFGEDTFPAMTEPPLGMASSDSLFPGDHSAFKTKQTDPRKRTQSIDKFLAQSPGSILGPRKKYVNNASGVPRGTGNGGSTSEFASSSPPVTTSGGVDDPLQYIISESPGIGLRGLRKRLDALDLRTPGPDEGGYYYYDQSQNTPRQTGQKPSSRSVGPAQTSMPRQLDSEQPQPDQQTMNGKTQQQNHLPQQQQQGVLGGQQEDFYHAESTMSGYGNTSAYMQQAMYMQQHQQYHHYMGDNADQHMAYYSSGGIPAPPQQPPVTSQQQYAQGMSQDSYQNPAQQFVPVGGPLSNGMQKVVFPNGVEAMVIPMMAPHQVGNTTWPNGVPPPPPAPPSSNAQYYHPQEDSGSKRSGRQSNKSRPDKQEPQSDNSTLILSNAPLHEFQGLIFRLSQEQNGCRFLQQRVDREGSNAVEMILSEVRSNLVTLMMDPFGNYLFQKLLEHANYEQRDIMLKETQDHLVEAALNLHGTRSVQKFIQVCGAEQSDYTQLDQVTSKLWPHITKMSMDQNGNHVVQRCLQHVPRDRASVVYDMIVKDVLIITRHRHGCCVFQRCIDAADPKQREALIDEVVRHGVDLMQDPFGNYVVQYVLEHSQHQEAGRIIAQLPTRMTLLSTQKFSSNVVEKCLQHASQAELEPLIDELCESEIMRKFLHDQYANYVVQRALQVANDKHGMRLVHAIRPHMTNLAATNASCARRVSSRVIKRFPALTTDKLFSAFAQK